MIPWELCHGAECGEKGLPRCHGHCAATARLRVKIVTLEMLYRIPHPIIISPFSPPTKSDIANPLRRIDNLYLDPTSPTKAYRLETYRSTGAISSTLSQQLRCYFVSRVTFPKSQPVLLEDGTTDIKSVADEGFLEKASENTLGIYQGVMSEVERRRGCVIEMFEVEDSRERRVVIGYK
jgi:hypothetical protein